MRGRNHFRANDVRRAIRSVKREGLAIGRIEIGRDGQIVIVPKAGDAPPAAGNEWDETAPGAA
jgi:hypothetical protein